MPLTKKQQQVYEWAIKGLSNKHIANRLNISESTVKLHMTSILKAYGVRSKPQLMASQVKPQPVQPPVLEDKPFAWVKGVNKTTHAVKGIMFGETSPGEGWYSLHLKKD